jgi:CubicO group peptidase (beta-lactamase class C family)
MQSVILVVVSITLCGQGFSAELAPTNIDDIFSKYSNPHSPGCSVGVIRGGNFVLRKSYGEASLELNSPLTSESVFYLASVSKQFTAASVVLAAEQGFLSLDDNVRKYIPELPDYSHAITLREMLHQTSGYRDFLALTYLAGRNISELSSADAVLQLIVRQKGLNNLPGDEFVYSNSNYFLLGLVIKRATGKSLAEFAAANIFQPLGMSHTLYYDDNGIVVPDRVAAYDSSENNTFRVDWSTIFDLVGGGGVMSSVDDLLFWDRNFYSNKLGKGFLARDLESPGVLNNGGEVNYGLGLWMEKYRGLRTVEHSGGTFGYRSELLRFPDQQFSVVVLCNVAAADVEGLARKITDRYLQQQLKADAETTSRSEALPDPAIFGGTYLDPRTHMTIGFTVSNGELMAWGANLRRLGGNEYSDLVGNPIVFERVNDTMSAVLTLRGQIFFSGKKVPDVHLNESELRNFSGEYHSDELDVTYRVSFAKGTFSLTIANGSPIELRPVAKNEFQAADLGTIVFHADDGLSRTPMTLFSRSARGISFRKMK